MNFNHCIATPSYSHVNFSGLPIPYLLIQGVDTDNLNSIFWCHDFCVASKWHIPASPKGGIPLFPGGTCSCSGAHSSHQRAWLKGKSLSWKEEKLLSLLFACWNKKHLRELKIFFTLGFQLVLTSEEWNPGDQWEEQIYLFHHIFLVLQINILKDTKFP